MGTSSTLVLSDLVDSTELSERLGDEQASALWGRHDRLARDLLAHFHGREIDRADGFLLLFDAAGDAVAYALAYQHALIGLSLHARVGIHVGPITFRENSSADIILGAKRVEVEGLAKPVAARIMNMARGGQTLLSATVKSVLGDKWPDGCAVVSHGYFRFKGVSDPVEVFELGAVGCSFRPPADGPKAHRVVPFGHQWRSAGKVRNNVPAERDEFVGRDNALHLLARRLDSGHRLVSVLGPAGVGKTRFVCRYGLAWLGDWPGGVYFCDLSESRSIDGICSVVAAALRVPLGKEEAATQIGHALAARDKCLLILDNFEQAIEHAPATVGKWLARAANTAFVVTSRERLRLQGETIFPLEPLSPQREAIELFILRATSQNPDFDVADESRSAIEEIATILDGLPLAIELAAARARVLSARQMVRKLDNRFHLLASSRGVTTRQSTLKAAIDWSWNLLSSWEQSALVQFSAFEGGFDLCAAEAVLDLSNWGDAPGAVDAVQALVDKSLLRSSHALQQESVELDGPRFGMYRSIHEYASQQRRSDIELAQIRHGQYFARFGSDDALESLLRHGGTERQRRLVVELDNLVAACRRAIDLGDGERAVPNYRAVCNVIELQGPYSLGVQLGASVLALNLAPPFQARALRSFGRACSSVAKPEISKASLRAALELSTQPSDRRFQGILLCDLGDLLCGQGELKESRALLEAALAIHAEVGNRCFEGIALSDLGGLHYAETRMAEAQRCYDAALVIHREVGNRQFEGRTLGNIGNLKFEQGWMDEARVQYEAARAVARETGDRRVEGIVLCTMGLLAQEKRLEEEAQAHFEASLTIQRDLGDRRLEAHVLSYLGKLRADQRLFAEARAHYSVALCINREVGNPNSETYLLRDLGRLLVDEGRMDEAWIYLEQARALARGLNNRSKEGNVLGYMANLRLAQGRIDEAFELVVEGQRLVREAGDKKELTWLLYCKCVAEIASGTPEVAGRTFRECETTASLIGGGPDYELRGNINSLRERLFSQPQYQASAIQAQVFLLR